jgi:hypothetical protein
MRIIVADIVRMIGLPRSIPFRNSATFAVEIIRQADDPEEMVLFEIVDGSDENGRASILSGEQLFESGHIVVRGDAQTHVQFSGQLQIRASFDGNTPVLFAASVLYRQAS